MNNRIHDPFHTGRPAVQQMDRLSQKTILYSNVGNLYRTAAEHYRRLADILEGPDEEGEIDEDVERISQSVAYRNMEEDLLEEAAFYAQGAADAAAEQCAQYFPESMVDNRTKSYD